LLVDVSVYETESMDVGEDAWVAEALEEGIHNMADRGRGVEHTEISIVHPGDVAKSGGTSIQRLGVHW
jgi:hypothetical protein